MITCSLQLSENVETKSINFLAFLDFKSKFIFTVKFFKKSQLTITPKKGNIKYRYVLWKKFERNFASNIFNGSSGNNLLSAKINVKTILLIPCNPENRITTTMGKETF